MSASGHATIQIVNPGVPTVVANAETTAMEDLVKIGSARSKALAAKEEAKGIKALQEAKAADEALLARLYTEQLGPEGAARVLETRELAGNLPEGLQTFIAGGSNNLPVKPVLPVGGNQQGGKTK